MGYYSDYQGTIRAAFADIDSAASTLDELRRLAVFDKPAFATMFEFHRDESTIIASVDAFEKWYDSDADVSALVNLLADHGATSVDGDVEVIGETPRDDMWRIHVVDGVVTTQDGHIVYGEAN